MNKPSRTQCGRCRDTLMPGNSFCLACGYENGDDAQGRKFRLEQAADARIARLKAIMNFLRCWTWTRWIR